MSRVNVLIDTLAADARAVRPLRPPLTRAAGWIAVVALLGGLAIYLLSDVQQLLRRYAGREGMLALEMLAMLATGVLAVIAAFFLAIPGRSRRWLFAPMVPFAAWLLLSGAGCYRDLVRNGPSGLEIGHSLDCLIFILVVSVALAPPLIWLLARARPIDPMPVALLGGLGVAALAAFILQFFHPFAATFVDLAVHLFAIATVVIVTTILNRRALSPA
ncbi:MAG: DUF1109 family protein [Sphingomonas sp.]|nr:DUF1109 family protein [Sphingomonas sp.]